MTKQTKPPPTPSTGPRQRLRVLDGGDGRGQLGGLETDGGIRDRLLRVDAARRYQQQRPVVAGQIHRVGLFKADGGVTSNPYAYMDMACSDSADLPLTGGCDGEPPTGTELVSNHPFGWSSPGGVWSCSWRQPVGPTVDLPNVAGHIVCIRADAGM